MPEQTPNNSGTNQCNKRDPELIVLKLSKESLALPLYIRARIFCLRWILPLVIQLLPVPRLVHFFKLRSVEDEKAGKYVAAICAYTDSLLGRRRNSRQRRCLLRSLLIYQALSRLGIQSEFNIRLQGDSRELGHCWISLDGDSVYDEPQEPVVDRVLICEDTPIVYWLTVKEQK